MAKPRVLVTGAAGFIASQMLPAFLERYACTLVDIKDVDRNGAAVPGVQLISLLPDRLDEIRQVFTGQDAVVHLAINGHGPEDRFEGEMDNIRMAYNVFRLSLEEGVRRVVVGSSNHAADFYEHLLLRRELEMLEPTADVRPLSDNFYGWAKDCYEHLGFVFAAGKLGRQLANVHIRIGAPRPIDLSTLRGGGDGYPYRRNLGAYISPRDLTQLFVKSIETENIENEWGVPWQVFYGVSDNTRAIWSIANARQVVGYEPEDDSEVVWAKEIYENLTSQGIKGRVGETA